MEEEQGERRIGCVMRRERERERERERGRERGREVERSRGRERERETEEGGGSCAKTTYVLYGRIIDREAPLRKHLSNPVENEEDADEWAAAALDAPAPQLVLHVS